MATGRFVLWGGVAAAIGLGAWLARGPATSFVAAGPGPEAVVERYCLDCHNRAEYAGDLSFEGLSPADVHGNPAVWERAAEMVRVGFMPPADAPRPEAAVLEDFVRELEQRLDRAAAARPNPGSKGLARLNRTEYRNAIRDLLALDAAEVVDTLPADDAVGGFDNIADALTVSPALIQGYVNAAMKISRAAVGDLEAGPSQKRYDAPPGLSQSEHIEGLPLGTRGGMIVTHNFPLDAEYEIRVGTRGFGALALQNYCPLPKVDVMVDGERIGSAGSDDIRIQIPAGPHTIAVALIDDTRCPGVNEFYGAASTPGGIQHIEILGPFDPTGPGDTPSRRAIFSCFPNQPSEEAACARQILARLTTKAYRRPISEDSAEVESLMGLYEQGALDGGFETGIQHALARILIDPRFLYRIEAEPEGLAPGDVYAVADFDLASRLSFFLWSSLPDDELLAKAAAGELSDPSVLRAQVARMLADPRSRALVENFAGQWLMLRELRDARPEDREFDANLREAFQRETELLFASVIEEDLSILTLLDPDYTFLNERLARHYGIDGVTGAYMRRVALDAESPRRGLLGHGSILTATSVANRTSPVVRGQWILENILGTAVPPPPPGVEADLSEEAAVANAETVRGRLEMHLSSGACASCHGRLDPFGLALENFDLIGRWRDTEGTYPIDAAVELPDGTRVEGPLDLRRELLKRRDMFARTFTKKLMTYALGRILEPGDMPTVRRVVGESQREGYKFSTIVLGIVESEPFRMRIKREEGGSQIDQERMSDSGEARSARAR